eukprot:TRINITY_DN5680_c0_g2_i4.p6 TRINITY_DN5680_c0_g2~~TRINITY_DN5680_c0_g2_i4.p6  ORF type:complete len:202 (-),score=-8.59 TRINITY_DN5680_c0_g2_i4:1-606(-)
MYDIQIILIQKPNLQKLLFSYYQLIFNELPYLFITFLVLFSKQNVTKDNFLTNDRYDGSKIDYFRIDISKTYKLNNIIINLFFQQIIATSKDQLYLYKYIPISLISFLVNRVHLITLANEFKSQRKEYVKSSSHVKQKLTSGKKTHLQYEKYTNYYKFQTYFQTLKPTITHIQIFSPSKRNKKKNTKILSLQNAEKNTPII